MYKTSNINNNLKKDLLYCCVYTSFERYEKEINGKFL